jgi:predicted DCC family thiol-disulfide oxidoreductase YuxK
MMSEDDNLQEMAATRAIDAFYDRDCSLCMREVNWLKKRAEAQRIHFIDVSAADFDPDRDAGMPIARLEDCIQARLESGEVLEGPEAIRRLYRVVSPERGQGRGRLPVLAGMVDLVHRWLAKRRLRRACRRIVDTCACAGRRSDRGIGVTPISRIAGQ